MSRRVAKSAQPLTLMTRTAVSLMLAVSTALSVNLTATALGVGMVSLSLGTTAQAKVTATDFSDLVSQVTPGVARVNVTKEISHEELAKAQTVELLRQFFGNRLQLPDTPPIPAVEHAYGTAFFVTKDGYMLTNHHVIEGADTITVTLSDRRELDAKLIGSDERSDVAVLKVEGNDFPALPLGDSNAIKVLQQALLAQNLVTFLVKPACHLSKPMWHSIQVIQVVLYLIVKDKSSVLTLASLAAQVAIWGCHFPFPLMRR